MADRRVPSPELEVLDILQGEATPLDQIRALYSSEERCVRATALMIEDGDVRLLDAAGNELPRWQRRAVLAGPENWRAGTGYRLSITSKGAERV